jgi:lysozyme
MKTGKKGIALIKQFEGCRLKAYNDPGTGGLPITIGFGSTRRPDGTKFKLGDVVTMERAEELLASTLTAYERIVLSKVSIPLTQNQFDALVCFTYNTGGSDTVFKMVNRKEKENIFREWFESHYIKGGGKVLPGLIRRRKAEADLFFS